MDNAIVGTAAPWVQSTEADLLHAGFALCDRKRHEAALLARFGKTRRGRGLRSIRDRWRYNGDRGLFFDS